MRIEADLFSGRPNPAWTLDAPQAAELASLLGRLRPASSAPAQAEGLGYRGLVVHGVESALPGCSVLRVHRGNAVAECGAERRGFTDPERAVERWLAASARGHVDADLHRTITEQVGS